MQAQVIISQDLSGVGQVSMSVALPLIAALGHQPLALPTALLSAHTGFSNNTYFDLSAQMPKILQHWQSLALKPQALLLGYLGGKALAVWQSWLPSFAAVPLKVIDPVMGDGGKLYRGFDQDYVAAMQKLVQQATVITPNPTEARLLLGDALDDQPLTPLVAQTLAQRLAERFNVAVAMTGVALTTGYVGVAGFADGQGWLLQTRRLAGHYFGTGDIFSAVVCGAMLRGQSLRQACDLAMQFESRAILSTLAAKADPLFGIDYTSELPWLLASVTQ